MDTQQAIDALTDHMAVYHRSAERLSAISPLDGDTKKTRMSVTKGGNIIRHRVIEWLSGLSVSQRQAALTIFDKPWVSLLLQMQQKLIENGPGNFIILPDVPAPNTSVEMNTESVGPHSSKHQKGKDKKGRASSNTRRPRASKGSKANHNEKLGGGRKDEGDPKPPNSKDFFSDCVTLPGLCFRKANGLLARLSSQQIAGETLLQGVQIFSSQDGEKGPVGCGPHPGYDTMIVTNNLVENLEMFLEVMDEISYGEFLEHPLGSVAAPWEETPWLQVQGYYSIAAFIANKLEISIWSSYTYSVGSKRPSKNSWGSKTNEASKHTRTPARVVDVFETAAVAQSVHGRKRGCVEWWGRVGSEVKEKTVRSALAAATKSEVIKTVVSARSAARSAKPAKQSQEFLRTRKFKGKALQWTSLSDTEADSFTLDPQHNSTTVTVSPLLAGLAALKEVAEIGILSAESGSLVPRSPGLFYSNLDSVHTLSDRVVRTLRNVMARVMNEAVEFELLEGEVGRKPLATESGKLGETKGSKEKKKRRKRSSAQKILQEGEDLNNEDLKPPEHCEPTIREDYVESTILQSQRTKIPVDNGVNLEFGGEKHQNTKSKARKSKTQKSGKLTHTGANLKLPPRHGDSSTKLEQFPRNGLHALNDGISGLNSETVVNSSCDSGDLEIRIKKPSICDAALCENHGGPRIGEVVTCGHERGVGSEGGMPDLVEQPHGAVTAAVSKTSDAVENLKMHDRNGHIRQAEIAKIRVLSPVGEEPNACQAASEICEVAVSDQDFGVPVDNPTSTLDKASPVGQSKEISSLQLRFGTIDLAAPDIGVPAIPESSTTLNALPSMIPDLQPHQRLSREHTLESGEGSNGPGGVKIKEQEDWIVEREKESTSEPVFDSNLRRTGFRSQSLPTGLLATGKLFTSRPTPTFFSEEPLLVHNLKGGSLRTQRNAPAFAMFCSHEWPGYQQVRLSGGTVRPTATERLHLDVIHDSPKRMGASSVSHANTAPAPGSLEWPPFVQNGYSLTPVVGYSDLNEPGVVKLSPFTSSPFASRTPPNGHARVGEDVEGEDRLYDTDLEVFEPYAGDFEDFDGYVVSEEEGERQIEDMNHVKAEDYNQFFGGGVMYWNSADYAGMGYSRPGSMSSDDSSWARREADLSVVLDDIVGIHPLPGSYRGKGSTSSNLSSTSPSQPSTSLPLSFEQIGASQVGPRVCLTRPTGSDFAVNYGSKSDDSQAPGPSVATTIGVVDGIMSDGFMPRLRPIVVVRDPGLSRSMVKNEAVRLREARSPHIAPRGAQDLLAGRRRRPSPPVMRHAPPPPPPSPVAGPKRRKGWMSARSGSSSPRHWGLTSWWNKEDVDTLEAHAINRDNVAGNGRRRGVLASTPPMRPLSGAVLREHLVAIPPLALDQEHMADEALLMQSSVLYNKNPTLHLVITLFHTALHKEIETFCMQVAAEKRLRMPFINTAVKKVAHSLQVLWPRSRTKIFGSNATGLALPTSDVDLVVSLPPVRKAREPIKQAGILEGRIDGVKETCLLHAARNLEDQEWVKSLQVIEHTVVPIIRLKAHILPHQCELGDISLSVKETSPMGTSNEVVDGSPTSQCSGDSSVKEGPWGSETDRQIVRLDISFEAPSNTGVRTSELVRELMGQFSPLTPLALVLKQFLADRSLDHAYKGGLSSYCQVLLITRFLQHQQHLGRPSSSQSLGSLFMDFLHFFGCVFDPRSMCVRIRGGGKYVSRDRGLSIDPLYIEDPFDYVNNVGSTCFRIQQIVKAFADAYSILEKELFEASAADGNIGGDSFNLLQKIIPSIVGN